MREDKEHAKPSWWKPGIEAPGPGCLCCPQTTELLDLTTKLYNGIGGWNIVKNGTQEFFAEDQNKDFDECRDMHHVESLIGDDEENEYVANFISGLRDATYQRHAKNTWVLIAKGPGYA